MRGKGDRKPERAKTNWVGSGGGSGLVVQRRKITKEGNG